MSKIHKSWEPFFKQEFEKPYAKALQAFVKDERSRYTILPPEGSIFNAFHLTALDDVKVVIIGQDPYHNKDQADGLAFSLPDAQLRSPTLNEIFAELVSDIGCMPPQTNNLTKWAQDGVLLLNSCLTVRVHSPGSHFNQGWEQFTSSVITEISDQHDNAVFIQWGNSAQNLCHSKIDESRHLILKSSHPSPLSSYKGFKGSRPFSKTNTYLVQHGKLPIDWKLN